MWSLLIVIVGLTVHAAQSAPAESSALQPIPALDYLSSWKRSVSIQQVQSQWKVSSIDKLSHVRTGNCVCLLWRGETSFKLTSVPFSSVSNQTLSLEYINYFTKRPILVKIVLKNNRSVEIASQTRRSEYKQEAIEQLSLTLPDYAKNQLQTIEVEFSVIKDESEPKSTITQTVLDAENVDSAVDANKYPDDKKGSGSEGKKDKPAEKADEDKENDEENKDYDEEEEEVNNNSHNHTINKLITIKLLDLRVADACHQNQQCLNEGVCRNRHANEFECQCPDNVNGQFCEGEKTFGLFLTIIITIIIIHILQTIKDQ